MSQQIMSIEHTHTHTHEKIVSTDALWRMSNRKRG
jgi:hypothetical protein